MSKLQKTQLYSLLLNNVTWVLQCALFFVEAYPAHCDCLALANILAHQLHREDSFDRSGSSSQHKAEPVNSNAGSNGGSGSVASQMDRAVQYVTQEGQGNQANSSSK